MAPEKLDRDPATAHPGDWVEVSGLRGRPARCGEVVEVLGVPDHVRFLIRWDDQHESILFPTDGVSLLREPPAAG
jgi:hypothetical protein